MYDIFIGIDNGVTGTIGILGGNSPVFVKTPTRKAAQDYQKTKKNITRIDTRMLAALLNSYSPQRTFILLERPLVTKERFYQTLSAMRSFEATLIIIETLGFPHDFIDSKEWQKLLLPDGIKGEAELKKASHDAGLKLFPSCSELIESHKDADGLLIAEFCRITRKI